LIWRLPKILVFTIKRFNFRRFSSDKLQTKIQFPIENLDLRQMTKESGTFHEIHPRRPEHQGCSVSPLRYRQPFRYALWWSLHSVNM
jgi:hypothetical protein